MATADGTDGRLDRVCVGRIAAAHGLRGDFCVRSFTQPADAIATYGPLRVGTGDRQLRVQVVGHRKDEPVLRAEGVADRSAAEALRGVHLYVDRAVLPGTEPDEYYHVDLIGLDVRMAGAAAADAAPFGRVTGVHDFGAGAVLEIARPGAAALLAPFTRAAVPAVALAAGYLELAALPGLIDAADDDARSAVADDDARSAVADDDARSAVADDDARSAAAVRKEPR